MSGREASGERKASSSSITAPPPSSGEDHDDTHCIICAEAFDNHMHRPGIGPCEHTGICGLCYIRLRRLMGDNSCPMCKTIQDSVFIFDQIRDGKCMYIHASPAPFLPPDDEAFLSKHIPLTY